MKRVILALTMVGALLLCTSSQIAKTRSTTPVGPCPSAESSESKISLDGVTVAYYWKCRQVLGDPEWDLYMKHDSNTRSTVQVFYTRYTYGANDRATDTSVFASTSYKMLDGGNTSSSQPDLRFSRAEFP
jgi:hypothetical protein